MGVKATQELFDELREPKHGSIPDVREKLAGFLPTLNGLRQEVAVLVGLQMMSALEETDPGIMSRYEQFRNKLGAADRQATRIAQEFTELIRTLADIGDELNGTVQEEKADDGTVTRTRTIGLRKAAEDARYENVWPER